MVNLGNFFAWVIEAGATWSTGLMPHGMCLLANPWLILAMIFANASIFVAYFAISFDLRWIMHRSPKLTSSAELFGFQRFVSLCGWTHLMCIVVLFLPFYYWEVSLLALTGLASLSTARIIRRERGRIVIAVEGSPSGLV